MIAHPNLSLSDEALALLNELAATHAGRGVPRLKDIQVAALAIDRLEADDVVFRTSDGSPLLAVSRRLLDRLGGEAKLVVDLSEVGEPTLRLIRESTVA